MTYQEAADVRRCARQPDGGWHRLPGIEMLMVVLRLLSVRASQVCCLADYSRFPRRCIYRAGDLRAPRRALNRVCGRLEGIAPVSCTES